MPQPPTPTRSGLDRWADWFSPGRFAILLAVLVAAEFFPVLLGWQTFVIRDYGFFSYPFAYLQRVSFWQGELPLWNPYSNCGVPFLAQWNTMLLYPPSLIYLLLPFTWAYAFLCLLHLWFGGFGMYWLARRWTGNSFAAAFAGVIFAFNGFTINMLMWPNHTAAIAWAPWVILAVQRAWTEGGRRIPLAAFVGGLQMLAGGPEPTFFTWGVLLVLWLVQVVTALRSGVRNAFPPAGRFALVVLLIGGLAAAQLLPFLDLVAHSQRESGYADTRWSMPATGWMNFLVPLAYTAKWNLGIYFQYDQGWTSSYYLGTGTLLLALLALGIPWRKTESEGPLGRGTIRLFVAMVVVAVLVSMGDHTFVSRCLRRVVPQMSLMTFPIKYVTVVVLLMPLLAAAAVARSALRGRSVAVLTAFMLVGISGILFWTRQHPFPTDDYHVTQVNGLARAGFLVVEAGLLLLLLRTGKFAWEHWVPLTLLLVVWFDLFTHMPTQNPTASPWVYQPGLARTKLAMQPQPALGGSRAMVSPQAEMGFLQTTLDPQNNFLVKRMGYFADANLLDAVPKVNGFFSLYPSEHGRLMSYLYNPSNTLNPHLLDFMGVSQLSAPEDFVKWQPRDSFLSLVTAGQKPVFLDDTNALGAVLLSDFDPAKIVFLPEEARSSVAVTNETRVRVLHPHFANDRVDFEVEAEEASLVVVAQTYYHCWRPYVDGRPVPLLRANYAFQALPVPAGQHQVEIIYEDLAFRVGVVVSGLSVAACIWMLILSRRRHGPGLDVEFEE